MSRRKGAGEQNCAKSQRRRGCGGEGEQQESFQSGSKLMKRLVRWPQGPLTPSMAPEMEM